MCCGQVISTARTCNLIMIVLDCLKPISHKKLIEHELEGFGIRLNKKPPAITFRKKDKGGLNFTTTISNPKLDLDSASLLARQPCAPASLEPAGGLLHSQSGYRRSFLLASLWSSGRFFQPHPGHRCRACSCNNTDLSTPEEASW